MELWQLDLIEIPLADGTEIKVLTGVDDHSRYCVSAQAMLRATGRAVCRGLAAALGRYGIPEEVLTDNGKQFTGRFGKPRPAEVLFERILRENGITHRLTRVRAPTTTGKVERFHQTLRKELLASLPPLPSLEVAQQVLDAWVQDYNQRRPHQALGGQTPAERFHTKPHPDQADQGHGVELPVWLPAGLGEEGAGAAAGGTSTVKADPPSVAVGPDPAAAGGAGHAGAGMREPGGGRPAGMAGAAAGRPHGPGATGRGDDACQPGRPAAQDAAVPPATRNPRPGSAGRCPTGWAGAGPRGRPRGAAGPRRRGRGRPARECRRDRRGGRPTGLGRAAAGRPDRSPCAWKRPPCTSSPMARWCGRCPPRCRSDARARLHGARLAHGGLVVPQGPLVVRRRASQRGQLQVAGERVQVGLAHARQVLTVHVAEREFRIFDEGGLIKVIARHDRQEVTRFKAHKQHKPHGNKG